MFAAEAEVYSKSATSQTSYRGTAAAVSTGGVRRFADISKIARKPRGGVGGRRRGEGALITRRVCFSFLVHARYHPRHSDKTEATRAISRRFAIIINWFRRDFIPSGKHCFRQIAFLGSLSRLIRWSPPIVGANEN